LSFLARRRVTLGFVAGLVTLLLAAPSSRSLAIGLVVACAGEAVRIWAAGHLEKSREVTRSGPYRWMRHPLYVGSSIIAVGVALAARSALVAVVIALYMASTLAAAIRSEEAFLRRAFGDTYDQYRESRAEPMARRFSASRVVRNREYRAVLGVLAGFALLALKLLWPI
jgi:protein-S-isoprenylcysteine O-methyltransferase Ste14